MKKIYPQHKKDLISVVVFLSALLLFAILINLFIDGSLIPAQADQLGLFTENTEISNSENQ